MKRTPLKAKKGLKAKTSLKSNSSLNSKSKLKSKGPMKRRSKKGAQIDREYSKLINDCDRELICGGCGTDDQLTNSHLIPRSRRPDLIADKRNVFIDCLECHDKWEKGGKLAKTLNDYDQRMQAVKEMDLEYYLIKVNRNE